MAGDAERSQVAVLGKEGCHLCEAVEAEIRSMRGMGARLTVIDIGKDQALHDRYWLKVPVVMVGGVEVFDATMMDAAGMWKEGLPLLLRG